MAASVGKDGDTQSSLLNQEAAVSSRTLVRPRLHQRAARRRAEFEDEKVDRPRGVVVVSRHGPKNVLPAEEAPHASLGKETSEDHRAVQATALSSSQGDGVVVAPHPTSLAQSFPSVPSAPPSGSLQPGSSDLRNVAQQLQDVDQRVATSTTRLLPPQLETTYVQVQPDQTRQKEKSVLCPSTVQSTVQSTTQPTKNSKILEVSVINPQIIQVQHLTGIESHQFFLCNSSEPTVQVLLQNPLTPLGQVSASEILTHRQQNKPVTTATTDSLNTTLVSACSANSFINCEKKQKVKKPLKVKTRSGRISQPAKYKIKDYKFIKIEDLADCHPSDSDDYSDLSLEDDESGKEKAMCSLFAPLMCNLRPKLFKCQSCDKSYIGKGGLARHYKLNPDHRQQELLHTSPANSPQKLALPEHTRKTSIKSHRIAEDRKSAQQQSSHPLCLGPGRPRRIRRCGQSRTDRSRYSGRCKRPGQFPSKSLNNMSAEHHSIFRRKARLKELIQRSPIDDFMELAVPRLTNLVTVFEFLLKKVEKKFPARALFPEVYKEFEELHDMVKRMCQDYFSNPELKKSMEIKNPKVAESLGIIDILKVQQIHTDSSSESIKTTCEHIFTGQKRASENSDEILPFAKKTTVGNLLKNVDYSKYSETEERSSPYEEMSSVTCICSGSALPEEQYESLEQETTCDQTDQELYDQCIQVRNKSLQPSSKSRSDCSDCLHFME